MNPKRIPGLLLDVLFPRRCPWCDAVVGFQGPCACETLVDELRENPAAPSKKKRHHNTAFLGQLCYVFSYSGPVQQAIHRLKYKNEQQLAAPLGLELGRWLQADETLAHCECILPVPAHPKTVRQRGFNQAQLLVQQLHKHSQLPLELHCLQKVHETQQQAMLDAPGRRANVLGVFAAQNPKAVQGKHVLLVDDVVTTGSTLDECAKVLLAAGAASCSALCLAGAQPPGPTAEDEKTPAV